MDTIPGILNQCVCAHGDRTALRCLTERESVAYTYRRLGSAAAAAARRLRTLGVAKGTSLGLLCENRPEWAVTYFAIHLTGSVCVPLDVRLKPAETRAILQRSRMRLLVVSPRCRSLADEAANGLEHVKTIGLGELLADADLGAEPDWPDDSAARADDPAVISFTSGTTGDSKGIVLTHRNIASNVQAAAGSLDIHRDDRLVSILPLHHLFEQTGGLLTPLLAGACITYPGTTNPRAIAEAMRESRTTLALIVPAIGRLFRKRILSAVESQPGWKQRLFRISLALAGLGRRLKLPVGKTLLRSVHAAFGGRMKLFISGGSALDPDIAEFFLNIGLPILQGYGLSETSPIVSCNTLARHVVGSVGRPLPGVEIRIKPGDGGGDGEIQVRGPNVMAGYFEDPQATEEALNDGWLCTGDLGRIDRRGYLHITGRLKDVIVGESGKNVYPSQIETEIERSPLVREACVLGVRPGSGVVNTEQIALLVVPAEDPPGHSPVDDCDDRLRQAVRQACARLADYKRPKLFAVWPGEFPRTTTLKIKKHQVRARLPEIRLEPL